jgi:hypothetical protein
LDWGGDEDDDDDDDAIGVLDLAPLPSCFGRHGHTGVGCPW